MPSRGAYCGPILFDFERLSEQKANIKYRDSDGKPTSAILNNTGIALTSSSPAENHQQEDGSVNIPKVLWPYMNGMKLTPQP